MLNKDEWLRRWEHRGRERGFFHYNLACEKNLTCEEGRNRRGRNCQDGVSNSGRAEVWDPKEGERED